MVFVYVHSRVSAIPVRHPVESAMDKDRVDGIGKKITGSVKEAIGKVTGDTKLQAEGTADKATGTAQNAVGGAKDTVRDAVKK